MEDTAYFNRRLENNKLVPMSTDRDTAIEIIDFLKLEWCPKCNAAVKPSHHSNVKFCAYCGAHTTSEIPMTPTPQRAQENQADRTQARPRPVIKHHSDRLWSREPNARYYDYAINLTDHLYSEYSHELKGARIGKTAFRSRRNSHAISWFRNCSHTYWSDPKKHQIVYSYYAIDRGVEEGWLTYSSQRYMTPVNAKGYEAVHYEVLHEFAHVLDMQRNGRRKGAMHPPSFHECMQELLVLFPYGEEIPVH